MVVPEPVGEPAPGGVEGVVRAVAEPVADVPVALFPLEAGEPTREGRQVRHTDDDGRYAFEDVPPGSYGVGVEWLAPPDADMLPQRLPFTSVAVAAGATTTAPDLFAVAPIVRLGVLEGGTALPGEVTLAWEPVPGASSYRVTL